jgi:hypothetical protein
MLPENMAFAVVSWSRSTSVGNSAWPAGRANASAVPNSTDSPYSCHSWTQCSHVRRATTATRALRVQVVSRSTLRGANRSLAAPPINISTARGSAADIIMVPRARLDPVRLKTSHGSATR